MPEGNEGGGDGGGGSSAGAGDFLASLPDSLRSDPTLKNFGGADGHVKVAQSYSELSRKLGSRSMAEMDAPTDDAGRRAVLTKLGHASPGTAGEYGLPDTTVGKDIREMSFKRGLTLEQAKGIHEDITIKQEAASKTRKERIEQQNTGFTEELKKEWGAEYDVKIDLRSRGVEHFLPKDVRDFIDATGMIPANNPHVVKMLSQVGESVKEGVMKAGGGPAGGPATVDGFKTERIKIEKEMAEMKAKDKFDATSVAFRDLTRRRQEFQTKEGMAKIAADAAVEGGGR